jgi:hypothetical protein
LLLAGQAGKAGSGVGAYADKAMVLLRKAFDLGSRIGRFRTKPSVDSLRPRENFQNLLAALEQKSAAGPAISPRNNSGGESSDAICTQTCPSAPSASGRA